MPEARETMPRPAELESRRLSSSAGRGIVSRASGAPELLNLDYRAHCQHIFRRRLMQVWGEFSHMGCLWAACVAVWEELAQAGKSAIAAELPA